MCGEGCLNVTYGSGSEEKAERSYSSCEKERDVGIKGIEGVVRVVDGIWDGFVSRTFLGNGRLYDVDCRVVNSGRRYGKDA